MKSLRSHLAIFLTAVAVALVAYGGVARGEPPKSLGDLKLVHALQGTEALREIDRLHGKEVGGTEGYVAHYKTNGSVAMLYLARAPSAAQAARQLGQMRNKIKKGGSSFYHLETSKKRGITLFSALGHGQIKYFYQLNTGVRWLAVDPPVAKQALAALLNMENGK